MYVHAVTTPRVLDVPTHFDGVRACLRVDTAALDGVHLSATGADRLRATSSRHHRLASRERVADQIRALTKTTRTVWRQI